MCVLCGEFITQVHWSERMDSRHSGSSALTAAGESQRSRMRARYSRVKMVNRVLALYGLSVADWNGSKYVVRDKKGSAAVIQSLGEIWFAVEKILGYPLDPLDPALLKKLNEQGNG